MNIDNVVNIIRQHLDVMPLNQFDTDVLTRAITVGLGGTQGNNDTVNTAIQALITAKANHQSDIDKMDSILNAINHCHQQKEATQSQSQQAEGEWRSRFRLLRGAMTEDMKQQHLQRIAQRELAGELDGLIAELELDKDRQTLACSASASRLHLVHKDALQAYASQEMSRSLSALSGLARAVKLKQQALDIEQAFTTNNGMFSEYEQNLDGVIFNEINQHLKHLAEGYIFNMDKEAALSDIGFNPPAVEYVNQHYLSSPCARQKAFKELQLREDALKRKGMPHD
ncbi:hypothetical protein [Serratia sp. NA_13]|uniref:hypothetical protein n=1 Tax=Serratia sp. NA_13 TaxID=3415658 RepID=UPI004046DF45